MALKRQISAEDMERLINDEAVCVKRQSGWRAECEADRQAIGEVVDKCSFCVTVRDPDDPDIPLIAVSDGFEAMTKYTRDDILGTNCRFLTQGCPVNTEDLMGLQVACRTGKPFTAMLPNRNRSGEFFVNLVDLQGLKVGYTEDGQDVWYIVGIQADVTDLAAEDASADEVPTKYLGALREVVAQIRGKLTWELGQFALAASDDFGCELKRQVSTDSTRSGDSTGSNCSCQSSVTVLEESEWIQDDSAMPVQQAPKPSRTLCRAATCPELTMCHPNRCDRQDQSRQATSTDGGRAAFAPASQVCHALRPSPLAVAPASLQAALVAASFVAGLCVARRAYKT